MNILISNDDGYLAPGINALAEALSEIAEVIIVAPDRNYSGASNSLTLDRPVRLHEVKKNYYYVSGTPTDCVHLAITTIFDNPPDIVVSGINNGENLGDDVIYSGTVAAAVEGRNLGLPSIAISLVGKAVYYDTAAYVAKELVKSIKNINLPRNTILNVNVPDLPIEELGILEVTRLGVRHLAQPAIKQVDPRGGAVYWMGLPGIAQDNSPGTDFHAIQSGNVSITPISLEWTNFQAFDNISSWVGGFNSEKQFGR